MKQMLYTALLMAVCSIKAQTLTITTPNDVIVEDKVNLTTMVNTTTYEGILPSNILVNNPELGTVNVDLNAVGKGNYTFTIQTHDPTHSWEIVRNSNVHDNFIGTITDVEPEEQITITFVSGPIETLHTVAGVTVHQRWNAEFGFPQMPQERVFGAITSARQLISESNAEEMLYNFDNMEVYLYVDPYGGVLGSANTQAQTIHLNIHDNGNGPTSGTSVHNYAGVIVHEVAHLYDGYPGVEFTLEANGGNILRWDDRRFVRNGYYNENEVEYFATSVSAYVGAFGGSHRIQNEDDYTNRILPLLITLFE